MRPATSCVVRPCLLSEAGHIHDRQTHELSARSATKDAPKVSAFGLICRGAVPFVERGHEPISESLGVAQLLAVAARHRSVLPFSRRVRKPIARSWTDLRWMWRAVERPRHVVVRSHRILRVSPATAYRSCLIEMPHGGTRGISHVVELPPTQAVGSFLA